MKIKLRVDYEVKYQRKKELSLDNFDEIIENVLKILEYYLPIKESYLDEIISDALYEELTYSGKYDEEILKEDFKFLYEDEYKLKIQNIDELIEYIKSKIPTDWITSKYTVAVLQTETITVDSSIFKSNEEEELFKSATKKEKEEFIRERTADMQKYQIRII